MTLCNPRSDENASPEAPSLPTWDILDDWARSRVQDFVQIILEEEVTELLGRHRHQRKPEIDADPGYRNGYGKPRRLTLKGGTITLRRPRVRNLDERFESRILPLFKRRTQAVGDLLPELYLHGLAERDFDMALRGLLGDGAPLSASTVARLKDKWHAEFALWNERRLDDLEVVYVWGDGVYVKAGLEKEKACLLVLIAALADGSKVVLAVEEGYRESTLSWKTLLRDLRDRGLRVPRLVVGDGAMGLWAALDEIFPATDQQRCWNHKMANVTDKVPEKHRIEAKERLRKVVYAKTLEKAEKERDRFIAWALKNGWEKAAKCLADDWDRMVTFYRYPKKHWIHLRTSNIVESPFAVVRLRTNAAKRYKKSSRAAAVIWKSLLIAEKTFRRLNAPELLKEVMEGAKFQDGTRIQPAAA